jgi:hypothetical protein
MDWNQQQEIQGMINSSIAKGFDFRSRKLGDTPLDNNQLVNRKYVNSNGTTANRPVSSVAGQQYFDTSIGRPVYWNPSIMTWVDGAGSVS